MSDNFFLYGFIFLFAVLIFLLLREVFCWYYKINELVKLQKEQIELLRQIAGAKEPAKTSDTPKS